MRTVNRGLAALFACAVFSTPFCAAQPPASAAQSPTSAAQVPVAPSAASASPVAGPPARVWAPAVPPTAASPPPPSATKCDIVDADAAAKILGYPVGPADASSRTAGICFFPTRSVSENGLVSYAVIGSERLPQRRRYFTALARLCAGVAKTAPRAPVCARYAALARAENLDAYFAARTSGPDAVAVAGLGEAAFTADGALYVRGGEAVYEIVVRKDRAFDAARSAALANALLARSPAPR